MNLAETKKIEKSSVHTETPIIFKQVYLKNVNINNPTHWSEQNKIFGVNYLATGYEYIWSYKPFQFDFLFS